MWQRRLVHPLLGCLAPMDLRRGLRRSARSAAPPPTCNNLSVGPVSRITENVAQPGGPRTSRHADAAVTPCSSHRTAFGPLRGRLRDQPTDIVHGDLVRRNVRIRDRTDVPEFVVLDWIWCGVGVRASTSSCSVTTSRVRGGRPSVRPVMSTVYGEVPGRDGRDLPIAIAARLDCKPTISFAYSWCDYRGLRSL